MTPFKIVPLIVTLLLAAQYGHCYGDLDKQYLNQAATKSDYSVEFISNSSAAMSHWVAFSRLPKSRVKIALTPETHVNLTFKFPFAGSFLQTIGISHFGYLWAEGLVADMYRIEPLMCLYFGFIERSRIYHYDNGTSFVVQWKDMEVSDHRPPGRFTFQVTMHKNGDIVFVYKSLPAAINDMREHFGKYVSVGVSNQYLISVGYPNVYLPQMDKESAIYFRATCDRFDSCEKCANSLAALNCIWCPTIPKCSNLGGLLSELAPSCKKYSFSDCINDDRLYIDHLAFYPVKHTTDLLPYRPNVSAGPPSERKLITFFTNVSLPASAINSTNISIIIGSEPSPQLANATRNADDTPAPNGSSRVEKGVMTLLAFMLFIGLLVIFALSLGVASQVSDWKRNAISLKSMGI